MKLKYTLVFSILSFFITNIVFSQQPSIDCEMHINFNFKLPSSVKGGILNNTEREHIASGIINFVNKNINENLYLTTYDDHSSGVRASALQTKYTTVFPDATTNTSNETQGGFFRIQDDFYNDTFKNIITNTTSGILNNSGITKKIDISFFVISEDRYADITASKAAYTDLLNSTKSNKIFFVFLEEGKFRDLAMNTYIYPAEFVNQLKGTTAIDYATTENITNSDYVIYSKAQIADVDFATRFSSFLEKAYSQVKTKKCGNTSCVPLIGTIKASAESQIINTNTIFSLETTATNLTYKWTFYNLDNSVNTTATTAQVSKSYSVAGDYKVSLEVTDDKGCMTLFDTTIAITQPCTPILGIIKILPSTATPKVSHSFSFSSPGRTSSSLACAQTSFSLTFYAVDTFLQVGTQMYTNVDLTTKVGSGDLWYQLGIDGISYRIGNDGIIAEVVNCAPPSSSPTTVSYHSLGGNPPAYVEGQDSEGFEDAGYVTYYTDAAQTLQVKKTFIGTHYHLGNVIEAPCLSFTHYGIISIVNAELCQY